MNLYFNMTHPDSERLIAEVKNSYGEGRRCSVTTEHRGGFPRIGPLFLQVKHDRRDEQIICGWWDFVIHESLLEEFEKEGFTGYQVKPATVRFRDGSETTDYREFVVTGWAGIASPGSGVQLVQSCNGCPYMEYSAITNYADVVDWSQWTGEDFFIVWPMAAYKLVTERVAQWLLARRVKSVRLEGGFTERESQPVLSRRGFTVGCLSDYLPEDLAIKYGRPLGLE